MRSLLIFICLFISTALLTNCSIYRMSIRQGNIVEQKDVDMIRKGMTKDQIRYILGRPLVKDAFGEDQWFYINTFKHGKSGDYTHSEFVVNFKEDRVVAMKGDFKMPEGFH